MTERTQQQQAPRNPLVAFKHDLVGKKEDYRNLLPAHIRPEKFIAAAMTAVSNNHDLLSADKGSLFNALSEACRDGLLPDNREAALVIHRTRVKGRNGAPDQWHDKVAYMPMVKGVLKKIRQSEEVKTITLQVVYQGENFDFWVDDEGEHLLHRPDFEVDREDNKIRLAYAMVRLTDGDVQTEIITKAELEKIRKASKTGAKGYGPWKDWYAQMAKKSALHRLAPKLPLSADLVELIERDNELYDLEGREEREINPVKPQKGRSSRLDALVGEPEPEEEGEHADDDA